MPAHWKSFENLVAQIHRILHPGVFTVDQDVKVTDAAGAKHQIDVLLRPNHPFSGPILVSCKGWLGKVGVDHVREWADIVNHTGAAAGVIVGEHGFTREAIKAASLQSRKISLWTPRRRTLEDFAPDENSPNGYVARVGAELRLLCPQPVESSFQFDLEVADPALRGTGQARQFTFSAANRDQFALRDSLDNVVGNLWDEYLRAAKEQRTSGLVEVNLHEDRYMVLSGVRLICHGFRFRIVVDEIVTKIDVDLTRDTLIYENAVTGEQRAIPLAASSLNY